MNLKNSQYQAIMRQYDLLQLQHRHLQSQRYQEICDRLPAYRQLEEETASFCADRARAAALGRKDVLQDMQQSSLNFRKSIRTLFSHSREMMFMTILLNFRLVDMREIS